ncbi:MAG: hypothetical protein IE914_00515, partial [Thiotrichales bacterium]|nr:hypothetical protein [Thiotrichales bacterium]
FLRAEKQFLNSHQPGYLTWQFYDSEHQKLPAFERQAAILQTLKKRENTKLYTDYLTDVSKKYQAAKASVKFFIRATSSTGTMLQPTLENKITASGFSLTPTNKDATDNINLDAAEKSTQAYGFTIIRSQATIAFYEGKKQLGSNQFSLKGQGLNNEQARINLQNDFKQQLQSSSLQQTLGLDKE